MQALSEGKRRSHSIAPRYPGHQGITHALPTRAETSGPGATADSAKRDRRRLLGLGARMFLGLTTYARLAHGEPALARIFQPKVNAKASTPGSRN